MSISLTSDSVLKATVYGNNKLRKDWSRSFGKKQEPETFSAKQLSAAGKPTARVGQEFEARNEVFYGMHKIPVNPRFPVPSSTHSYVDRTGVNQGGLNLSKHVNSLKGVERSHVPTDDSTDPVVQTVFEQEDEDMGDAPPDVDYQPFASSVAF